tara:strand:+ start:1676 stop:1873 length:198 start_codon:yes stop_codon:yes gene_type:complete
MPREELAQQRLKEESRRKMAEWDSMIPDGAFEDANISEKLTTRYVDRKQQDKYTGASSLESCRES